MFKNILFYFFVSLIFISCNRSGISKNEARETDFLINTKELINKFGIPKLKNMIRFSQLLIYIVMRRKEHVSFVSIFVLDLTKKTS